MFCTKACSQADKTADGLYAHLECLRRYQVQLTAKTDKGGNLYQGSR